jgi:hypothetical protein
MSVLRLALIIMDGIPVETIRPGYNVLLPIEARSGTGGRRMGNAEWAAHKGKQLGRKRRGTSELDQRHAGLPRDSPGGLHETASRNLRS